MIKWLKSFIVISLILLSLTAMGQNSPKAQLLKRHLGWATQDGQMLPVILTESASNSYIQLILSGRKIVNLNLEVRGWIFTTDDKLVALDISSGQIDSRQTLVFAIGQKEISSMKSFTLRLDGNFFVFNVKPRTHGLSNEAQFLFDQLDNIPGYELAAYEVGDKGLELIDPEMKVRILNLKTQLSKLNVNISWDAGKKQYVIP